MKKKIIVTELHMDYIVLKGLLAEENEVFTDFGKGLVHGYMNSDIKKTLPIVPMEQYQELLVKYEELKKTISKKKRGPYKKKEPVKKGLWYRWG